jgi:hypothetical protein
VKTPEDTGDTMLIQVTGRKLNLSIDNRRQRQNDILKR